MAKAAAKKKTVPKKKKTVIGFTTAKIVEDGLKVYGTHTIEERALPDFRDGLNPVQRRILWAALGEGAVPPKASRKSATIVGSTLGNYHPHADTGIYQALVNMVNLPVPLIEGTGAFGIPTLGIGPASQRYTEARLSAFTMNTLLDPRLLAVTPMLPNFDGSKQEPLCLPAKLPLVLLNGAYGIAVATTTSIPSFKFESVKKVVRLALDKRAKKKTDRLTDAEVKGLLAPASPAGGRLLSSPKEVKDMLSNVDGSLRWQCAYEMDEKARTVTLTGFAPEWKFLTAIDRIRNNPDVASVEDLSEDRKLCVVIRFKKTVSVSGVIDDFAEKYLTTRVNYRFNVTERFSTDEGGAVESSAKFSSTTVTDLLNRWIDWRLEVETAAALHEAAGLTKDIERETAFLKMIPLLDKIVAILKSKTIKDKVAAIAKVLGCSIEVAKLVWQSPISRFDRLKESEQEKKIAALTAAHKKAMAISKSPAKYVAEGVSDIMFEPSAAGPKKARRTRKEKH